MRNVPRSNAQRSNKAPSGTWSGRGFSFGILIDLATSSLCELTRSAAYLYFGLIGSPPMMSPFSFTLR